MRSEDSSSPSIGNGVNQKWKFPGQMSQYSPRCLLALLANLNKVNNGRPGFQRL